MKIAELLNESLADENVDAIKKELAKTGPNHHCIFRGFTDIDRMDIATLHADASISKQLAQKISQSSKTIKFGCSLLVPTINRFPGWCILTMRIASNLVYVHLNKNEKSAQSTNRQYSAPLSHKFSFPFTGAKDAVSKIDAECYTTIRQLIK